MTPPATPRDWLEIGEPTISKIELGCQAIKGPNVRLLCQLYDVDASTVDTMLRLASEANQRGWWTAYRDTVPDWFRQFVGLEGDASELWEYQAEFIPGLMQTTEYVKAAGSFVMMQFPEEDDPAFAYLENDRGALYQEDPGDIARYSVMADELAERALSEENTRTMIDEAARSQ